MGKKVFTPLLVLAIMALLAGGGILWWSVKSNVPLAEPTPTVTPAPTTSPTTEPTTPAEETESDFDLIKQAFAEKHSKPLSETTLSIEQNTGTYAKGGGKFAGEISGAWWLAYHDASGWIIVADGNGTVLCSDIESYNFPVDMVPECWDEDAGELVIRE